MSPVYVRYTYEHGRHGIPWWLSACANSVYQALSPPPPPHLGTRLVTCRSDTSATLSSVIKGSVVHKSTRKWLIWLIEADKSYRAYFSKCDIYALLMWRPFKNRAIPTYGMLLYSMIMQVIDMTLNCHFIIPLPHVQQYSASNTTMVILYHWKLYVKHQGKLWHVCERFNSGWATSGQRL